jgi:uncharacterized membrane protein YgcG
MRVSLTRRSGRWVVLVFWLAATTLSYARSWRIADYNTAIAVAPDGSAVVDERITLEFSGEFHGIHRTIPVKYPGPRGSNYTLLLNVMSVTDAAGHKYKYESHLSRGYRDLKIYIPDAVDAMRVVEIRFAVRNGIRYFDNYDEFYWNVTGNDWPVPIDHASATVALPQSAAGSVRAQAFTGVYGSTEGAARTQIQGANVNFETLGGLPMQGGLTIDLYLPKGFLKEPGSLTRFWWFLSSNPIVLLPFWALAVMWVMWRYKGRDPDPGMSVAPMYEPPAGMTPAEAGTLIDDSVDPRDITSTLIDLAVRGYVKIEETVEKGLIFDSKDYVFHLLRPREQWNDLNAHEKVMLENIFYGDDMTIDVRLRGLKNRFYTAIPAIRTDIISALRNKNMYLLDPESANLYKGLGLVLIAAPFVLGGLTGVLDLPGSGAFLVLCGVLALLVWWPFARQMTCRTMQGSRTRIAVLGFQEFMNRVDADRLKRMPPDTFEKYLPFAMALGVENRWAKAFEGIVHDPPQWYVSPHPGIMFNPVYFTNNMSSFTSEAHQVFVSAPRSSSSGSGFGAGGGGFSGGGFGGGGGSAF